MLQFTPVPLLSQQRGVPPSIEHVGNLSESTHAVELHPVQTTIPLVQEQPLELLDEITPEEELEDDELEDELVEEVDEQTTKEVSQTK